MNAKQSPFQDPELNARLNVLDNIYDQEQYADILHSKQVNTDIDLQSIEEALMQVEQDECVEFYEQTNEIPEEVIDFYDELNSTEEFLNSLTEQELNELLYDVPDCLQEQY